MCFKCLRHLFSPSELNYAVNIYICVWLMGTAMNSTCAFSSVTLAADTALSSVQWVENVMNWLYYYDLPQLFSSEPSVQSRSPLQKSPRSMQLPSPQAKKPSWHKGSSVYSSGFTLRSLFFSLQFLTESFQSHVCFSMSKNRPAGHRIACRPWKYNMSYDRR